MRGRRLVPPRRNFSENPPLKDVGGELIDKREVHHLGVGGELAAALGQLVGQDGRLREAAERLLDNELQGAPGGAPARSVIRAALLDRCSCSPGELGKLHLVLEVEQQQQSAQAEGDMLDHFDQPTTQHGVLEADARGLRGDEARHQCREHLAACDEPPRNKVAESALARTADLDVAEHGLRIGEATLLDPALQACVKLQHEVSAGNFSKVEKQTFLWSGLHPPPNICILSLHASSPNSEKRTHR